MAINVSKIKATSTGSRVEQAPLEAATYPTRVVQIIDLGLQPQRAWEGEEKPPAYTLMMTYEFTDEFCVDKEGNEDESKPRWLSEEFPLHPLTADLAKSTKRYKALDPELVHEGDFGELLGAAVNTTVSANPGKGKNAGRVFNNIMSLSTMRSRDEARTAPLVNTPKMFDLSTPDLEIFGSLPEWIQDKIKGNLEFKGSPLEVAMNGGKVALPEEPAQSGESDDQPW